MFIDHTDNLDKIINKMVVPTYSNLYSYEVKRIDLEYLVYYAVDFIIDRKAEESEVFDIMYKTHDLFNMLGPKETEIIRLTFIKNRPA